MLGEVYVDSILQAQRRLAGSLIIGIVLLVVGLPMVLLFVPEALDLGPFTVPASWVGLGVLVYPIALLVTTWYVRAAERVEREFAELMDLP
ncbi:hypothetical protein GCM10025883_03500 [Mobilicoccus caccae]|uniref:DUF485 domain-containing protein n=1 Tax=Mobilicoccus caccae TaxID=1859295 RepID=A0ABQ6IK84_9MICO|nr:hypothetical protein GCM10025883_03500 [Mobilicoccus caccae]